MQIKSCSQVLAILFSGTTSFCPLYAAISLIKLAITVTKRKYVENLHIMGIFL